MKSTNHITNCPSCGYDMTHLSNTQTWEGDPIGEVTHEYHLCQDCMVIKEVAYTSDGLVGMGVNIYRSQIDTSMLMIAY